MTDHYKKALRTTMKRVRANTSAQFRATASQRICHKIRGLESYRHAKHIALYFAVQGEVDLTMLWRTAPLHGKRCYFPKINDDTSLSFLPATPATAFKYNRYGIEEPDVSEDEAIAPEQLDLILMPVVAFDRRCVRIGMGAGYYDRSLVDVAESSLIGVAYQFQQVDFINPQPWDISLASVITERSIYRREDGHS